MPRSGCSSFEHSQNRSTTTPTGRSRSSLVNRSVARTCPCGWPARPGSRVRCFTSGTAREQADKMGMGYDGSRLTSDPTYNVMLGSAYFQRMLNIWDGSVPLAVASYNAGSGNVGKWIRQYGDPRDRVDMLKWIEAIPYVETKAYVQRVIENSVVYDSMRG